MNNTKQILSALICRVTIAALLFTITGCSSGNSTQNTNTGSDDVSFSEIEIIEEEEEVEISEDEETGGF